MIYFRGGPNFKIKSSDAYQPLAVYFQLTEQERIKTRRFRDGRYEPEWNNMVQWARNELRKLGYLVKPSPRSIWQLSDIGVAAAKQILNKHKTLQLTLLPEKTEQISSESGIPISENSLTLPDIEELNVAVLEGGKKLVSHFRRERNAKIVNEKKEQVLKSNGKLICEACGFDFVEFYGLIGYGFCEAHHRKPLSEVENRTKTKLEDLALMCSNCHRMIHRTKPMATIEQFRKLIKK